MRGYRTTPSVNKRDRPRELYRSGARAGERICGMPRGRALGQTLGELLGSPAVDRELGHWPAGEPVEVETVRADGGELQLAITVVPLPGGVPGDFALYARDVTRAKRA